jgi:hypothetical protein
MLVVLRGIFVLQTGWQLTHDSLSPAWVLTTVLFVCLCVMALPPFLFSSVCPLPVPVRRLALVY